MMEKTQIMLQNIALFLVNTVLKTHNHMRHLMGKFYIKILKIFGKVLDIDAPAPYGSSTNQG
jgi:hypothetical protein